MWSDVVITVSGMWLRRDVKAAYVFIRVFLKDKGLGSLEAAERDEQRYREALEREESRHREMVEREERREREAAAREERLLTLLEKFAPQK